GERPPPAPKAPRPPPPAPTAVSACSSVRSPFVFTTETAYHKTVQKAIRRAAEGVVPAGGPFIAHIAQNINSFFVNIINFSLYQRGAAGCIIAEENQSTPLLDGGR